MCSLTNFLTFTQAPNSQDFNNLVPFLCISQLLPHCQWMLSRYKARLEWL